jgi:glycosyltransferase involved in cell wall biosynthesis
VRVLLMTDWTSNPGGTEETTALLRDGLRAAGDEVRLLTSSVGAGAAAGAEYVAHGSERPAAQVALQVVNPSAVARVRAARREFAPDVAVVLMFEMHLSPAALLALGDVPTIAVVLYPKPVCPTALRLLPDGSLCESRAGAVCWRGGCVSLPHWLRDVPRYRLIRRALRDARAVLTCSVDVRDLLRAEGIPAEAVDLAAVAPGPGFARRPAPDPLFVYVGRLSPEKGVDVLVRAFARLHRHTPRARLRIVGNGPLRPAIERQVAELGCAGAVDFRGWVPPDEVEAELADPWALVAPSLWPEPFGLVAVEAAMRGVPVVASATGGFARTVEPGVNGLLFPNGDEEALADRLAAVADGSAFPTRSVDPAAVARARRRFDPDDWVSDMRTRIEAVAAA